jgi:hypothetical protein
MAQAGFKKGTATETPADLLARFGPTLLVDIGLKSRSPVGQKPDLQEKGVRALIDTGAGANCIDEDLAIALQLPLSEAGELVGVDGRKPANIYLARLYVPSLDRMLFERLWGAKLQEGEQWQKVILGREFLRRYRMTYDAPSGNVEIIEP